MYSLFISDLHLKVSESSEYYSNFIAFLDSIKDCCHQLYILGDLFTYWYEHAGVDFYSANPALRAIKEFRESGKEVYFIYGNRDFTAGEFFRRYSGVNFIGSQMSFYSGGKRVFLTHGDSFAKKDIRYRIWRTFIRFPLSVFVFKRLPIGYAIYLADKLKDAAKGGHIKEKGIAGMIMRSVSDWFKRGYEVIIVGHAHFKAYRRYDSDGKTGELYILPEFKFPGEVLTAKDGVFEYRRFG